MRCKCYIHTNINLNVSEWYAWGSDILQPIKNWGTNQTLQENVCPKVAYEGARGMGRQNSPIYFKDR